MTDEILSELSAVFVILPSMLPTALATAFIEVIFWFLLKYRNFRFLMLIFFLNIITNLAVNFLFLYAEQNPLNILLAETAVIITEYLCISFYLRNVSKRKIFILSFFSNLLTYLSGLFYFTVFK